MNSYLNQIFYNDNKFDNFSDLEKWMLTGQMFEMVKHMDKNQTDDCIHPSCEINATPTENVPLQKEPKQIFIPKNQDSLFWCIYAASYGATSYWMIGNKYKNMEMEEKQKMVDFIKTQATILKGFTPKISQTTLQEAKSDLLLDKKTSWWTFQIMCIYYKIHAIVIYENTFFEFQPQSESVADTKCFLFNRNKDGHLSIDLEPIDTEKRGEIYSQKIRLDYTKERPIRALSAYKVDDLKTMADKLGVNTEALGSKPKKEDWYNAVLRKCSW